MPRDATNTPASHTSALGELFIADEWGRTQGKVYEFDSQEWIHAFHPSWRNIESTFIHDILSARIFPAAVFASSRPGVQLAVREKPSPRRTQRVTRKVYVS